MRTLFRVFCVLVVWLLVAASCGAKDAGVDGTHLPAFALVAVWLDGHPALTARDAVAGCAFWCFKGVSCVVVADRARASVVVKADLARCDRAGDGTYHLGDAWYDEKRGVATVNLRVDCFRNGFPRSLEEPYDRFKVRSVLAHEFGHAFGIWDHVPEGCAGVRPAEDAALPVCGDALMNALWEEKTPCPTAIDALAFDARNARLSVLRPGALPLGSTARCVCAPGLD